MQAIALTDFIHGDINAVEGSPVTHRNGGALRQALAEDLERAGLIRIKADAPAGAKPAADTSKSAAGKAPDDGAGQPSSALPAAPVSPITTSSLSKPGAKRVVKRGR